MRYSDGPNTRQNGKKQRCDPVQETLRKIDRTKEIGQDDIGQLYNLDKPYCSGCRTNSKDSPNCFCGLVPTSGVRKQGLWQKASEMMADLGPDPSERMRPDGSSPSGLTNLGATCYVNSVLQCLYMNRAFRYGVLSAEPELVERQPVLYQLCRLFALLHCGKRNAVDSAAFASTLELDNAIQQDGQEFMKLLLSLLERVLSQSRNRHAQNVVQNVFRGTFSYVTKCARCRQDSDASKQLVDFYELELNVKGFSSLEESMEDYFSEEKLQGENQYLCELCKVRVDATHYTQLRSLPPVLNFHLKRFVFNSKTATKKKVTSKFSFPRTLDMAPRLCGSGVAGSGAGGRRSLYTLSAILVHRGNMANSGHYVAHVKDECTGQWWQLDDEDVTSLGYHPLGEVPTGMARKRDVEGKDGERSSRNLDGPGDGNASSVDQDVLTSADAYMLMYSSVDQPSNSHGAVLESLPEQLQREADQINEEFCRSCDEYNVKKEYVMHEIANRKAEVRDTLAEVQVKEQELTFHWISADWLRNWADNLQPPPPIDNHQLLCHHEKVPPKKLPLMKRLSVMAWKLLESKYGGGPALSSKDFCASCIFEEAKLSAHADSFRDQRAAMRELADAVCRRPTSDGDQYYVSRPWFLQWHRRKPADAPIEADATPTAALRCQHGQLLPEDAPSAKRQAVPEVLWQYFRQTAALVEGADPVGYQAFERDSDTCPVCDIQRKLVASKQEGLRANKLEQRQKHDALYMGKSPVLVPGVTYYLVPTNWILQWRTYLGASGKNVLTVDEPNGLEAMILSLICPMHDRLIHKPPLLCRTRKGELVQRTSNEDNFTVVTEADWHYLQQEWCVDPGRGIKATVLEANPLGEGSSGIIERTGSKSSKSQTTAPTDDPEICAAKMDLDDVEYRQSPVVPILVTHPEVCRLCAEDMESLELMSKLNYSHGTITVDLVRGKEPPPSVLAASGPGPEIDRRTSKRPRRGSASTSGRVSLTVSSETTIYQLKLQIWEALSVAIKNQRLHFGKEELTKESATLADVNILDGSHLWVMDTGEYENLDIAEELPDMEFSQPTGVEEGFRGTRLLMGGLSSLVEATHGQYDAIPTDLEKLDAATNTLPEPLHQLPSNTTEMASNLEYVDETKHGLQDRISDSLDGFRVELRIVEETDGLQSAQACPTVDVDMDDSLEDCTASSKSCKSSDTDRSDPLSRVVNMKESFVRT